MTATTTTTTTTAAPAAPATGRPLRALTLMQPWATLVAAGEKRQETRGWRTAYRGWVAIHAAKGFPVGARQLVASRPFAEALAAASAEGLWHPSRPPLGAVVAVARLVDVVATHPMGPPNAAVSAVTGGAVPAGARERAFGNFAPGRYAWLLADVTPLPAPIPARGALGLWTWEAPEEVWALLAGPAGPAGPAPASPAR